MSRLAVSGQHWSAPVREVRLSRSASTEALEGFARLAWGSDLRRV